MTDEVVQKFKNNTKVQLVFVSDKIILRKRG
ncbi:hypothetical protein BARVI_02575 [Barnesiella viscericola DSM 18177]|uniref:Uncharacterized protein n=1 Tax=Barnesiella viscericola DSM 18177 TaxID=880074 RepID=W0ES24_9BACT|nr:hypothetical protein BARVI_02575 [Barnesiella viscericola DSM 18177]